MFFILFQDSMGNPEASGGLSHCKSTNRFQDQLLYGSQVRN